jgi:hypothetical protein
MGDIEPKGRWKASTVDYDFIRSLSADTCFYCLSKRQAAIIQAALEFYRYKTRWYSPTGDTLDTDWIEATIDDLLGELMTDHCDIDATLTEITNSITTINENIVTVNNNLTIVQNTVNQTVIDIDYIYVQNNSLNVNVILQNFFTFSASSEDITQTDVYARYNALCQALYRWAKDIIYRRLADIDAASSEAVAALDELAALGGQVFGNIFGTNPGSYTLAQIHAAATSTTDLDAVICQMITTLQNLVPSFLTFGGALTTFVPANFNQTVITSILVSALVFEGAFQAFAGILDVEFIKARAVGPLGYTCTACIPAGACALQTWDFSLGEKRQWTIERGQMVYGTGIIGKAIPGDANLTWSVRLVFSTPCATLINKTIHAFARNLPTSAGNPIWLECFYLNAGVRTRYRSTAFSAPAQTWNSFADFSVSLGTPPGGAGISELWIHGNTAYYAAGTASLTANDLWKIQIA